MNLINILRDKLTLVHRFIIFSIIFLLQSLPFMISGELNTFGTILSIFLIPLVYPLFYVFIFIYSLIFIYGFQSNWKDLHYSSNKGTIILIDICIVWLIIMLILGYIGVTEMTPY